MGRAAGFDPPPQQVLRLGPAPPQSLSLLLGASESTMWVTACSGNGPERRRQEISVRLSQRRHRAAEAMVAPCCCEQLAQAIEETSGAIAEQPRGGSEQTLGGRRGAWQATN